MGDETESASSKFYALVLSACRAKQRSGDLQHCRRVLLDLLVLPGLLVLSVLLVLCVLLVLRVLLVFVHFAGFARFASFVRFASFARFADFARFASSARQLWTLVTIVIYEADNYAARTGEKHQPTVSYARAGRRAQLVPSVHRLTAHKVRVQG